MVFSNIRHSVERDVSTPSALLYSIVNMCLSERAGINYSAGGMRWTTMCMFTTRQVNKNRQGVLFWLSTLKKGILFGCGQLSLKLPENIS